MKLEAARAEQLEASTKVYASRREYRESVDRVRKYGGSVDRDAEVTAAKFHVANLEVKLSDAEEEEKKVDGKLTSTS